MAENEFYITKHIGARDDGLCPRKLPENYSGTIVTKPHDPAAPMEISHETNSHILKHDIRDLHDSSAELEFICEAISKFVMENVDEDEQQSALVGLDFEIEGCIWKIALNPNLGAPGLSIFVSLAAKHHEDKKSTIWVTQTSLVSLDNMTVVSRADVEEKTTLKAAFEQTALVIRKAVLSCEFPEFPEGCKDKRFKDVYKLNAKLKTGSFSTICRGTHRVSGRVVAVKCVRRQDLPPEDDTGVYEEVAILASLSLQPPHIVPLIDFFEEDETYFLVKELLTGGGVLERIGDMGYRYNERIARGVVFNIMEALSFCHARHIAHRDVNSKNLMFVNEDKDTGIKLAGFGFATRCLAPKCLLKQCGTPFFVAPEVLLKKPYGMESDMWSAGCVAFLLLSGNLPFLGSSQKDLFRNIVAGKFEFGEDWEETSDEAKDFVRRLLIVDPTKRLNAEDALDHPWMRLPESELNPRILEDTSLRIRDFHQKMHPKNDTNSN
eukprot:Nitzschia sp. Nitz4//scaffold36_size144017//78439//79993//NITZ4_003098-RA/size144017-processed-gene-0.49-mRNA-1//1//CDS//3329549492//5307//frame0